VKSLADGSLRVFSARQLHQPVNLNGVVFWEGNAVEPDAYELAHTDYTIYDRDGRFLKKVKNARGVNDPAPTEVALPAGAYRVEAEARDTGLVRVPVVVRPGQSTIVNLQKSWSLPDAQDRREEFVWWDGRAVGWRVSGSRDAVGSSPGSNSTPQKGPGIFPDR